MHDHLIALAAWAVVVALVALEIAPGIDNLVVLPIVAGRLPGRQSRIARRVCIGQAPILRRAPLGVTAWIVGLPAPV